MRYITAFKIQRLSKIPISEIKRLLLSSNTYKEFGYSRGMLEKELEIKTQKHRQKQTQKQKHCKKKYEK